MVSTGIYFNFMPFTYILTESVLQRNN